MMLMLRSTQIIAKCIDDDVIDVVNDFTTLALHHQIADVCFAANKHLLTQKPLAISVAAARKMVDGAKKTD